MNGELPLFLLLQVVFHCTQVPVVCFVSRLWWPEIRYELDAVGRLVADQRFVKLQLVNEWLSH
jgi:hypothetical protein